MPGASLFALLDDIASILDDVAVLTKVATQKTAGVLGDDLALNAQQVTGVSAERELPVVWAVAKGSLVNKAILVPAALGISTLAPWAVTPLLMVGGAYLGYEGVEKLAHRALHTKAETEAEHAKLLEAVQNPTVDLVALEREKVRGAIRTDFILSAEIVTISLGSVAASPFVTQLAVLVSISLLMTAGVYGVVAGIVKLDDLGLYLNQRAGAGPSSQARLQRLVGGGLLKVAPLLMKALSVAGTLAMFLVGGGILTHGVPGLHEWLHHHWVLPVQAVPIVGGVVGVLLPRLVDLLAALVTGTVVLAAVTGARRLLNKPAK